MKDELQTEWIAKRNAVLDAGAPSRIGKQNPAREAALADLRIVESKMDAAGIWHAPIKS